MKYLWVLVSLAVFLNGVSNQEDLIEDEVEEKSSGGDGDSDGEPAPSFAPPTKPSGDVYFTESFTDGTESWVKSEATKDDGSARYDGEWKVEAATTDGAFDEDDGLVLSEAAKHYAIAAKLDRPFVFKNTEAFVVQYEVNFQDGLTCGGAYIKLLTEADNLNQFQDKTPYSIMFGPDKCGLSSKVHFIIRFKNPITGEIEEKHSKQSDSSMEFFNDKKTHLFTLLIRSDGVYHVIVDQVPFLKGSLMDDLTPPIVPPQEIDDPDDRMPESWDEREKIPDSEAVKPDDWDEDAPPKIQDSDASKPDGWLDDGPEYIPDPDASIPEDWDEEEDGEYEPPMIPNPACEEVGCGTWKPTMIQNPSYKGKWKAPLIDNPHYDGKWAPRKIDNPSYFEDSSPFFSLSPISAIGFELWSMSEDIYFDNIIISSELAIANNYAREGWVLKMQKERTFGGVLSLNSWLDSFVEWANAYPYLWALYAIAVVMPFVCCVGCCCVRSNKPKADEAGRRKKTDEPTPDDKDGDEPKISPAGSKDEEASFIAEADDKGDEGSQPGDNGSQTEGDNGSQAEDDNGSQAEAGSQAEDDNGSQAEDGAGGGGGGGSQAEDEAEKVASTEDSVRKRNKSNKKKSKSRRED